MMKKRLFDLLFVSLMSVSLFSCGPSNDVPPDNRTKYGTDFYDNYYDDINTWTDGADLKSKLYTIIRQDYHALPYTSPNWETNQYADQALDDFEQVDVVYDSINEMKDDTYSSGMGWQKEHAFAASLMTGYISGDAVTSNAGRATDYHNLFASYLKGNTSRGNKNFGMADPTDENYAIGKDGLGDFKSDSLNFEPSDFDKGRMARAIFYMGVMYSTEESETISISDGGSYQVTYEPLTIQEDYVSYSKVSYALYGNNTDLVNTYGSGLAGYEAYSRANCSFAIGNLSTLLSWNTFSVDRLEYQHNISVYSHVYSGTNYAQGNRNPFVDYPELVDYIYGDKANEAGELTYLCPTSYSLDVTSGTEINNYAINSAKRSYNIGDTFTKSDYALVEVHDDFSTAANTTFIDTTADYTFTSADLSAGYKTMSIVTDINTISYDVAVTSLDPMESCTYNYVLTGKAAGCDLNGFTNGNSVTLGGTPWTISWTNTSATIGNRNADYGVAFGTSTTSVNSLTFATTNTIQNASRFYAKISCASGKTINYTMKIGETIIKSGTVSKVSGVTTSPEIVGASIDTPISGALTMIINGSGATNGAVYVYSLAYQNS